MSHRKGIFKSWFNKKDQEEDIGEYILSNPKLARELKQAVRDNFAAFRDGESFTFTSETTGETFQVRQLG